MVGEAIAGLGAIKTAFDLAKGLKDIHDTTTRDRAVIDLQKEILAAQQAQTALIQRVGDLEKQVAQFEKWETDRERYELKEVAPGVRAYSIKEAVRGTEPAHEVCATCYGHRHLAMLQKQHWQPMRCEVLVCNDCGAVLYLKGQPHPDHKSLRPTPLPA